MNWLILVAIAVITDSIRIFTDNYTSDVYFKKRGAVSQKLFYGVASIILGIVILIITGFSFRNLDINIVLLLLSSGILVAIAGIPYYRALEIEDSTNIGIFIQLAPVLYLILGWFFLDETITPLQFVAFAIILSAPMLIIFSTKKRSRKVEIKAVLHAFLYVLLAVVGNLFFVKADDGTYHFIDELSIMFIGKGIANIIIVFAYPKWKRRFFNVIEKSKGKVFRPLIANSLIGAIKDYAYRGALVAAPTAAIASVASDSAEPIVIFFMGLVLTLIWPKFGREKLNKRIVAVHLIATILVVIGIIILRL